MATLVQTLMLKEDRPGVEEARARLNSALDAARGAGLLVLKVVHGYGASGFGGTLRDAVRRSLRKRRKEGRIRAFVGGEEWSAFNETAQLIVRECPELERDPDLNRYNEGVTFVLL